MCFYLRITFTQMFYSDIGFEHSDYNSPCVPVDGYEPFLPTDCTVGDYYNISNGYVYLPYLFN